MTWFFDIPDISEEISRLSQHHWALKVPVVSAVYFKPHIPLIFEKIIGLCDSSNTRRCRGIHWSAKISENTFSLLWQPWHHWCLKSINSQNSSEKILRLSQHQKTSEVPVVSAVLASSSYPISFRKNLWYIPTNSVLGKAWVDIET
jgi:hypothetical protein